MSAVELGEAMERAEKDWARLVGGFRSCCRSRLEREGMEFTPDQLDDLAQDCALVWLQVGSGETGIPLYCLDGFASWGIAYLIGWVAGQVVSRSPWFFPVRRLADWESPVIGEDGFIVNGMSCVPYVAKYALAVELGR